MANQTLNSKICLRADTASNWSVANPTLLRGEFGYETDTRKFKLGDGTTAWNTLKYASALPSVSATSDPSTTDNSYDIGTQWVNTNTKGIFILVSNPSGVADWDKLAKFDDLSELGGGDMLASVFASVASSQGKSGYVDKALQADKLTTTRTITLTGDASGSTNFDGSGNVSIAVTLATLLTAGTGCKITVNEKGLVTAIANLQASDIPNLTASKITDLGNVATLNSGLSNGNVVVVQSDGYIDDSIIPKIAITDTYEADSQANMLLLTTAEKGDICIRSDENKCYILAGTDYSVLSNWKELKTPGGGVISVNTKTGVVSLTADDIPESASPVNKYYTQARFNTDFATAIAATASTSLSDGASIVKNTDTLILNGGYANGFTQ